MKKILSVLLASVMMLSLAACSNQPTEEKSSSESSSKQTASLETTYPVTLTDALGREVTLDAEPERLVSGYYITTSYLTALDLEDKLVGIEAKAGTRELYQLAAPELPSLPNVGSLKQFNLETCVSTEPDLVILSAKVPEAVAKLEELGIPVLAVNPETEQDFKETISMIGTACNVQERVNALTESYDKVIADLSAKLEGIEPVRVYLGGNSALLSTAGPSMFQDLLIRNAGAENAAAELTDPYWATVSYEQLLAWNPDAIVLAPMAEYTVEDVLADPALADLDAVKNGKIYAMPNVIESWDSPIPSSCLGSVWMASVLYPDAVSTEDYKKACVDFYQQFYGFDAAPVL